MKTVSVITEHYGVTNFVQTEYTTVSLSGCKTWLTFYDMRLNEFMSVVLKVNLEKDLREGKYTALNGEDIDTKANVDEFIKNIHSPNGQPDNLVLVLSEADDCDVFKLIDEAADFIPVCEEFEDSEKKKKKEKKEKKKRFKLEIEELMSRVDRLLEENIDQNVSIEVLFDKINDAISDQESTNTYVLNAIDTFSVKLEFLEKK